MTRKKNIILLWSMIFFSLLYLGLVIVVVYNDYGECWNVILTDKIKKNLYLLPRIYLYFLEYFSGILVFITCLFYLKKKKVIFMLCSIFSFANIYFCIKNNLPLYGRETFIYGTRWKTDAIEYLYPVSFLWIICFLAFFPAIVDILEKFQKEKKISIGLAIFTSVSTDFVKILDDPISISPIILCVKIGLFILIYKLFICQKDMEIRIQKKYCIALEILVPLFLILIIVISQTKIGSNYLIIMQKTQIDGYWFIGGTSAFIETYENPYIDKRHYLKFEYVDEKEANEFFEGYKWYYDEENDSQMIKTFERKLEGVYYLDIFEKSEYEESNLHRIDLSRLTSSSISDSRDYRVVLSAQQYENVEFYYRLTEKIPYKSTSAYAYFGEIKPRDIERYDILIENKEIPAYFLGMVENYHVVRVEPYLHYWGENNFESRKDPIAHNGKLRTIRQY